MIIIEYRYQLGNLFGLYRKVLHGYKETFIYLIRRLYWSEITACLNKKKKNLIEKEYFPIS
jgi:hypothetical protein